MVILTDTSATRMPKFSALLFVLTALLNFGAFTFAHAHSGGTLSYGNWEAEGNTLHAQLRVRAIDFRQIPGEYMQHGLPKFVEENTHPSPAAGCRPEFEKHHASDDGWVHIEIQWQCVRNPDSIELNWLQFLPGHLHLIRRSAPASNGTGIANRTEVQLLRGGQPQTLPWENVASQSFVAPIKQQWQHGLMHIAGGWDHLAFLLGLILLAQRLRTVAVLITGFTIGHSVSLILATQRDVLPPSTTVELAIAASIIFISLPKASVPNRANRGLAWLTILSLCALAAFAQAGDPLIWAGLFLLSVSHRALPEHSAPLAQLVMATVFGLMHGFGFAAEILADAESATQAWPILLGFNLGVESGQLLFVIPAWLLLQQIQRFSKPEPLIQATVLGIGSFALFGRLLATL